jgi:hypothetical protein
VAPTRSILLTAAIHSSNQERADKQESTMLPTRAPILQAHPLAAATQDSPNYIYVCQYKCAGTNNHLTVQAQWILVHRHNLTHDAPTTATHQTALYYCIQIPSIITTFFCAVTQSKQVIIGHLIAHHHIYFNLCQIAQTSNTTKIRGWVQS